MPEHGVLLEPVLTPSPRTPPGLAAVVGPRPSANVGRSPQVASSPAADRHGEVGSAAKLVGSLLGYAEELGYVGESEHVRSRHGPHVPTIVSRAPVLPSTHFVRNLPAVLEDRPPSWQDPVGGDVHVHEVCRILLDKITKQIDRPAQVFRTQ